MALLKIYKCQHCKTRFVAMRTFTQSLLPVEVENGQEYDDDDMFDEKRHKSHLLTCLPRRLEWKFIKKKMLDIENREIAEALSPKNLLR